MTLSIRSEIEESQHGRERDPALRSYDTESLEIVLEASSAYKKKDKEEDDRPNKDHNQ